MSFETIIGLEVHIQLATEKKAFCDCSTSFGAPPNTQVCPICLGQEPTAPHLNRQAVEYALKAALALNCQIPSVAAFDRKHYAAPDLPKGYQITQWRTPFGKEGYLEVAVGEEIKRVPIKQVHLEEDAGRALPRETGLSVDFNRAGIPLIEVVTPPVFCSAQEARAYLEALQLLMRYLGVSTARLEEGSMRCEVNISLRPRGSKTMGELCEIKNIGSFSGVVAAITYEEQRQKALLAQGYPVPRETRRWDEERKATFPMRSKEQASDYGYEPEPHIPPLIIDPAWLEQLRQQLPELPVAKQRRYQEQLGLSPYQARELTSDPAFAHYFEEALQFYPASQDLANWLLTEVRALLNSAAISIAACPISPQELAELLQLVRAGTLSHNLAKDLLAEGFASGQAPAALARQRRVQQISDRQQLRVWVEQVLAEHGAVVEDYHGGKKQAFGFLVGQVMRLSGGLANPKLVNQILQQVLTESEK